MNCAVIDGALMDGIDIGFAAIDGVSNIDVIDGIEWNHLHSIYRYFAVNVDA